MSSLQLQQRNVIPRIFHELRTVPEPDYLTALSGPPVPTTQESEKYVGLGGDSGMERWNGARKLESVRDIGYRVVNDVFSKGLFLTLDEIDRDQTGLLDRRVAGLRTAYQNHWIEMAAESLATGESTLGYDGKALFATDHEEGESGEQSNKLTVSGTSSQTVPTGADIKKAFWAARRQMRGYVTDRARPAVPDLSSMILMVPNAFEEGAIDAFAAMIGQSGAAVPNSTVNIDGTLVRIVVNPWLPDGTGEAFEKSLVVIAGDGQAFIRQQERTKEGGDFRILYKDNRLDFRRDDYAVETKRAMAPGDWKRIVKCTLAA